ncbi:MAG: DUF308 domain-containing protein [Eubacterium sp.]|nr:DUF308 domain-containing protein [Eubacterium sp.]
MVKKFNGIIFAMIAVSIITILVGIAMVCWPLKAIYTYALLIGCYFIVQGIIQIVMGIRAAKYNLPHDGTAFGVLSLILGILAVVAFVKNPELTTIYWALFMGISLGISIIFTAIFDIKTAFLLKKDPQSNWVIILVLGIITLILGISMMSIPFTGALAETIMIGIIMIVFGVVSLIDSIFLKTQSNKYENAVKRQAEDVSEFINKN